jgi:MFS family permease
MDLDHTTTKTSGRVFYGWWIVMAAALIGVYSGGTFIYGLTVFINPVIRDFGWSYLEVSAAISVTGALIGVFAPIVGSIVDRYGSRLVLVGSAILSGTGFILLGFTDSIAWFYMAFSILSLGSAGCGSIVLQAPIANWFRRRVGFAMGITSAGVGIGGILVPAITWLVSQYQWRMASIIIGVGTVIVICIMAIFIRQRPEKYGLLPDGDRPSASFLAVNVNTKPVNKSARRDLSAKVALRGRAFWILALAISIYFFGLNAVVIHIMPFLESVSLEPGTAAFVVTFLPVFSIVGRIGYGWLGDHIKRKYALALTLLSQAMGLVIFVFAPVTWSLLLFVIIYGSGFGGSIALGPAMIREYFGRTSFGSIQGWMIASSTLAGVSGPILAGWIFDTQHSYNPAWLIFAAANVIGLVLVMWLRPLKSSPI